jgi:hypothetical protein
VELSAYRESDIERERVGDLLDLLDLLPHGVGTAPQLDSCPVQEAQPISRTVHPIRHFQQIRRTLNNKMLRLRPNVATIQIMLLGSAKSGSRGAGLPLISARKDTI